MVNRNRIAGIKRSLNQAFEEEAKPKTLTDSQLKKRFKVTHEVSITLERLDPSLSPSILNRLEITQSVLETKRLWKGNPSNLNSLNEENHDSDSDYLSMRTSSSSADSGIVTVNRFCVKCNRCISGPLELFQSHLKTHKYLMPYECKFKNCNASFHHKDNLKEHYVEHKKLFRNYCVECGQRFRRKVYLKQHVLKSHSSSTYYKHKCAFCEKGFFNKSHHERHELTHSDVIMFTCHLCRAGFKSKSGFKMHMNSHYDIRPFKCPACPKRFVNSASCEHHYTVHHNRTKQFKCDNCNSLFRSKYTLRNHMRNPCSAKLKPFDCPECQTPYSNKYSLRTHLVNIHGHEKTSKNTVLTAHSCPECDESFPSLPRVKTHRIQVHGYKPKHYKPTKIFECSYPKCRRSFSYSYNLNRHVRGVHGQGKSQKQKSLSNSVETGTDLAVENKE